MSDDEDDAHVTVADYKKLRIKEKRDIAIIRARAKKERLDREKHRKRKLREKFLKDKIKKEIEPKKQEKRKKKIAERKAKEEEDKKKKANEVKMRELLQVGEYVWNILFSRLNPILCPALAHLLISFIS